MYWYIILIDAGEEANIVVSGGIFSDVGDIEVYLERYFEGSHKRDILYESLTREYLIAWTDMVF
jgi:hypothetical protein